MPVPKLSLRWSSPRTPSRTRRQSDRRDRALRRRGRRHRPDRAPGSDRDPRGRYAGDAARADPASRAPAAAGGCPPLPRRQANTGRVRVIERALISVYDKSGLDEFAQALAELGVEIVSSGGTSAYLEEMGVPVARTEEITQVRELLGARVEALLSR